MHELSIAESILEILERKLPPDAVLAGAELRIGALQSIDDESLRFGWRAVLAAVGRSEAPLNIHRIPWRLRCGVCGNEWEPADAAYQATSCHCGVGESVTIAGRELEIIAFDVDYATDQRESTDHILRTNPRRSSPPVALTQGIEHENPRSGKCAQVKR